MLMTVFLSVVALYFISIALSSVSLKRTLAVTLPGKLESPSGEIRVSSSVVSSIGLASPESGITLEVYTNEPGIQVYTGNFLDGTVTGKKGITYNQRASVCLETQHYPDSPNKPEWPSVVLEPGQTYNSECIFKFSVEK